MRIKTRIFLLAAGWIIAGFLLVKAPAVYAGCYCWDAAKSCCGWASDYSPPDECDLPGAATNPDCSEKTGCGTYTYILKWMTAQGTWRASCPACWSSDASYAHDLYPDNLEISYETEDSLRVTWEPGRWPLVSDPDPNNEDDYANMGEVNTDQELVEWTNDPASYGKCAINSTSNPCEYVKLGGGVYATDGYEDSAGVGSFLIENVNPDDHYYVKVSSKTLHLGTKYKYMTSFADCPDTSDWVIYPPACAVQPKNLTLAPGQTGEVELVSYGEVDEVNFKSSQNSYFTLNTGDTSNYKNTTNWNTWDKSSPYKVTVTATKAGRTLPVSVTSYVYNPEYDPLHPTWHEPLIQACIDEMWVTVTEETEPPESDAWFQVADGNVHSTGSVVDRIPSTCTGSCVPNLITGTSGLVSYLDTLALGSGSVNETGADWHAETVYRDTQTGYAYFKRLLADDPAGINNWPDGTLPDDSGIYLHEGNISTEGVWEVVDGEHLILLVDGSVNVAANITAAKGGFLAIIASGDITISPEVTDVAGVFIADGAIHTGSATTQLVAQGIFTGWSGFYLERNLADNTATPAELFIYRPDLQLNAYKYLTWLDIDWHEVAP